MKYDRGQAYVTVKKPWPAFLVEYRSRHGVSGYAAGPNRTSVLAQDPSSRFG